MGQIDLAELAIKIKDMARASEPDPKIFSRDFDLVCNIRKELEKLVKEVDNGGDTKAD